MLSNLSGYDIILASGSPRRKELLAGLGLKFRTFCLPNIDESYPHDLYAEKVARYVAEKKADAYKQIISENELYITADTIVVCQDKVLGKPSNRQAAIEMLKQLSGREHKVVTGVSIVSQNRHVSFSVETEVKFCDLTADEIAFYVDTYKPFDKAGAYAAQECGSMIIEAIDGNFDNVMGLPCGLVKKMLKEF